MRDRAPYYTKGEPQVLVVSCASSDRGSATALRSSWRPDCVVLSATCPDGDTVVSATVWLDAEGVAALAALLTQHLAALAVAANPQRPVGEV